MGRTIQLGSKRANKVRAIAVNLFERLGRPVLLSELIAEVEANHNEVASSDSVGYLFRSNYFREMVVANDYPQDIHKYPIKVFVGSEDCGKTHRIEVRVFKTWTARAWTLEERQEAFERMKRRHPFVSKKKPGLILWIAFWVFGAIDVAWLIYWVVLR